MMYLKGCENLRRFYVYVLVDSGTDQIFYVGKGSGDRVFSHLRLWRRGVISNVRKSERITQIYDAGHSVLEKCLADNLAEHDAFEFERQIIETIGIDNLTNIRDGDRRRCKPKVISAKMTEWRTRRNAQVRAEQDSAAEACGITAALLHSRLDEAIRIAARKGRWREMMEAVFVKSHIRDRAVEARP